MAHALDRHLVLTGFMGAGKTTLGREVAGRLDRHFYDVDEELASLTDESIPEMFERYGEDAFRELEAADMGGYLNLADRLVVSLGGGAVETAEVRMRLRDVFTILVEVDVDTAWERVRGGDRPLAQDEASFRALYERRQPLYHGVADAIATDADGIVLAAGGIHLAPEALGRLGELVPSDGPIALVSDAHVAGIHGPAAQVALGDRLVSTHEVPPGESAKSLAVAEDLWRELRLERSGTIVALGGGSTTDVAGFVAASYLRGIAWVAVPTTLVGQIDAAIGGKTAVNLPEGKNLVGVFHWPERVVIDPSLLETLPARERSEGMAEVVKTGLLAGEAPWELPELELVRRCAAFKAAICLRDPRERGVRAILNLGHTFAHALEAASDLAVSHGSAVALGLLAALRLSGHDTSAVEQVLRPERVRVDRDRAWAAMRRDKKSQAGKLRLVLLGADGPEWKVELPDEEVRRALDELIAG